MRDWQKEWHVLRRSEARDWASIVFAKFDTDSLEIVYFVVGDILGTAFLVIMMHFGGL